MTPEHSDWLVPHAARPVHALVDLPGSKSMTNRALVLSALAEGPVEIVAPLAARDTRLMAEGLRALGCVITETDGSWVVEPLSGQPGRRAGRSAEVDVDVDFDVGNAGTVLRFLPAVAAMSGMQVRFTGDPRIAERPVGPLLRALTELGARISAGGTGSVPFTVHGEDRLAGGEVTLDASSSSQLISGLLLAAPRFTAGASIRHHGPPVPSAPHIEMSVRMLRACGVQVVTSPETGSAAGNPTGRREVSAAAAETGPRHDRATSPGTGFAAGNPSGPGQFDECEWKVFPGSISGAQFVIEPDLSNAVPFLAAALATGGTVTVAGWPADSLQPAQRIIDVLTAMGAEITHTGSGLRVSGSGQISGIEADLSAVGELTPVLTALAALAGSPSRFTGIGHLRRHETDRLAALAGEIGKLGGDVTELDDGLAIKPRPLRANGVVFDSHDDHRLVMAAAVLGLVTGGLRVGNAATVGKTFPGFGEYWATALVPSG
jgi:3-phosphoshikimate 1-carboxyvinyltransferase